MTLPQPPAQPPGLQAPADDLSPFRLTATQPPSSVLLVLAPDDATYIAFLEQEQVDPAHAEWHGTEEGLRFSEFHFWAKDRPATVVRITGASS